MTGSANCSNITYLIAHLCLRKACSGRKVGRAVGRSGGRADEQSAVPAACSKMWPALRGAGGPKTRPGRSARCSAAHGSAQARAACTALGHLVGMQCMQAGPLVRVTRVWQRQRMIEGISGSERLLQVPERASKNNAGRHSC